MNVQKIILASQSQRRSQLLQLAEIPFEVITQDTDESYPENLSPHEIAKHIAENKARAVMHVENRFNSYPILAADTIVVLHEKIIGKPKDRTAAIATLLALSGNTHSVITGVCIFYKEKKVCFSNETFVEFNHLSEDDILYYVDKYKPYDKAGAYAIQEWIGAIGIKKITGDYYNVVGLPVQQVLQELKKL